MADIALIATMTFAIVLLTAYVAWCDRIVSSETDLPARIDAASDPADRPAGGGA